MFEMEYESDITGAYNSHTNICFRWKMKVKQLEREVDRHKHGANQLIQRNEQLVKDLESHRHQLHHNSIQMENMKRELGDALVSLVALHRGRGGFLVSSTMP